MPKRAAIAEWRWTTHSSVPVPSKSKRWTSSPSWSPAWGPEPVDDRPGDDRQLAERDQGPHRPDAEAVGGAPPLSGLVARAPGKGEGGVEQDHREDEVAHHELGSEVVLDHQRAEHRLADHAERQQDAEEGQVPAVGPAEEGERAGRDDREPDEAGDDPVSVLDHRVELDRRHRAAVALGPVRAAETGAGEADRRTRGDDRCQRDQGHEGDPAYRSGVTLNRSRIDRNHAKRQAPPGTRWTSCPPRPRPGRRRRGPRWRSRRLGDQVVDELLDLVAGMRVP